MAFPEELQVMGARKGRSLGGEKMWLSDWLERGVS